jgi:hypothetical protein
MKRLTQVLVGAGNCSVERLGRFTLCQKQLGIILAPHWWSFGRTVHLIRSMKPLCTVTFTMCGKWPCVMNIRISFAKHCPRPKIWNTPSYPTAFQQNLTKWYLMKSELANRCDKRKEFMKANKECKYVSFYILIQWCWYNKIGLNLHNTKCFVTKHIIICYIVISKIWIHIKNKFNT